MSFDKEWSNYVLHNIDSQKLDQIIINLECKIVGCRANNRKSLKNIHQSVKIGALSKRLRIGKEVREEIEKLYKAVLEKEEVQSYLQMTPAEFLAQIETFKEQEDQEVQLGVVNCFLQASTTLTSEKDEIVKYFKIAKKEDKAIQDTKKEAEELIKQPVIEEIAEEREQVSKKDSKDLKILKHLYQEAKQREEQQEQKIKALTQDLHNVSKISEEQEKTYKKELKDLKCSLEQLNQDYKRLESEKEVIEDKLKQAKQGTPYVFIGSDFIRKKLEIIKCKHYPEVNAVYLSTKQWENRLGKAKHEVAEVYAFFYDLEWLVRDTLYEEYQEKLKIFPTDELFYDYIEQHWEA